MAGGLSGRSTRGVMSFEPAQYAISGQRAPSSLGQRVARLGGCRCRASQSLDLTLIQEAFTGERLPSAQHLARLGCPGAIFTTAWKGASDLRRLRDSPPGRRLHPVQRRLETAQTSGEPGPHRACRKPGRNEPSSPGRGGGYPQKQHWTAGGVAEERRWTDKAEGVAGFKASHGRASAGEACGAAGRWARLPLMRAQ